MRVLYDFLLCFAIYSFVGWACETVYCSVPARRFINRGFLNGPFCPVYGFGALLVITLLQPFSPNVLLIFLLGALLTSLLEYVTAYILEKSFHTKWWDYSKRKCNLHGRVCLKNSALFGLLCVLLMRFVHPFVLRLLRLLPGWAAPGISLALLAYFITDSAITVRSMLQFNGKLAQMEEVMADLAKRKEQLKRKLQEGLEEKLDDHVKDRLDRLTSRLQEMEKSSKAIQRRLLAAFPNMRSIRHEESLRRVKLQIEARRKERKENKTK